MLFDVTGIKGVLFALLCVLALAALDLSCSRDEAPAGGALSRVRREVTHGRRAFAGMQADQLDEQLRSLRALARKLVREGRHVEARSVMTTIMDMQKDAKRLRRKAEETSGAPQGAGKESR